MPHADCPGLAPRVFTHLLFPPPPPNPPTRRAHSFIMTPERQERRGTLIVGLPSLPELAAPTPPQNSVLPEPLVEIPSIT